MPGGATDSGGTPLPVTVQRGAMVSSGFVDVTIEGVERKALVDTGSSATLVRPDIVPANIQVTPQSVFMRTISGDLAPIQGQCVLNLCVGGWSVNQLVWVAAIPEQCVLGLDFLRTLGCQINLGLGEDDTLQLQNGSVVVLSRVGELVTELKSAGEPGWCQGEGGVEPNAPGVDTVGSPLPRTDRQAKRQQRKGRQRAQTQQHTSVVQRIWQANKEGLDAQQSEQLKALLWEFKDTFAADITDVGRTPLVAHDIDTGDARPIRCRPRRLPLIRQQAAEKEVEEMLRAGVIEQSDSPWASGVVLVQKKSGDWRFCVDYRPLNEVTRKDSYPLPRVDEMLDLVSGSSWFTSLDLRSGYWQVPLTPDAKAKTAFYAGRGLYQFTVLPFGLCNAPATFARLMDQVLAGVPRQECLVFLDDILVHGGSFKEALQSLRGVLGKIQGAGLKLHPDKCHFLRREVEFLGHRVGAGGISTVPEKVRAVAEWPVPANRRQLKSFLGLASYYRKFVPGFSRVADPLHRLLETGREFLWSEQCQIAFGELKRALCEAPTLAPADPNLPFILDTDASDVGIGGVLAQVGPEGERVVAYYSSSLSREQRRYCVTRRELLAVVESIKHFRYYLTGAHFTVRTDHAALQWLLAFREPEGQVARWLEFLQAFDFRVEHRAGTRHQNADALSRRPCAADGCSHCARREAREAEVLGDRLEVVSQAVVVCQALEEVGSADWAREQNKDPDLRPALCWVRAQSRPSWEEVTSASIATKGLWEHFDSLRLEQGVLQRAWVEPTTGEVRWRVVVPRGMQELVLKAMHGTAGSGHFGAAKTLARLRQSFYWGRQARDVKDFCRRCDECTAQKGPSGTSRAPLQQRRAGAPMERVAVDIVGPFPLSDRGNRYVLTAMDYFTKWPEAYAIPDQEAETVCNALVEGMFSRFGVPEELHSDQGRNFESRVFACMCEKLGIYKTRTTPLHPQSDGLVERFHRTMKDQLAIATSQHQRDWDDHLPMVLMAYRSAVQTSSGCSPALLMLGRELRTPAMLAVGMPPDAKELPPGPEYARKLQDRLDAAHDFAREQLEEAGARQKRYYDLSSRGRHFAEGEEVWVYSPQRKKGRCPKLDSSWVGPCLVLKEIGAVVYRVRLPNGKRLVLHRDRLAPYQGGAAIAVGGLGQTNSPTGAPGPPQAERRRGRPLVRGELGDSGGGTELGDGGSSDTQDAPPATSTGLGATDLGVRARPTRERRLPAGLADYDLS